MLVLQNQLVSKAGSHYCKLPLKTGEGGLEDKEVTGPDDIFTVKEERKTALKTS